jgi:uncharacterized cupin superfamily protein
MHASASTSQPGSKPDPAISRCASTPREAATWTISAPMRALGALFGLNNFGVNLTEMAPATVSALRHAHTRQDEFNYGLQRRPVLRTDAGDMPLAPGMCAGFRAGTGRAHPLVNPTDETIVHLEIGDRSVGDS